jgi:nucleolar complex protein 2
VPKNLLKSRDFQEECILSAIQILSAHFAQWSYHVSFPEVATIPLVLLKRLHEQTTVESLRRPIKRLIDQVNRQSKILHVVTMHSKDLYTLHGTIHIIRQEH